MEEFELYIDRLKAGEYKEFSLKTSPELMQADDNEFSFNDDIHAQVSATIASDHLILNISIKTIVKNSCKICNDPISHDILIEQNHVPFLLTEAKGAIFSLRPYVREQIYLNIPKYSECGGKCPERAAIDKYLSNSDDPQED
ncbi:MAG: hypothetical protein S4CHLAM20_03430 [Chlamydiia bacterium]|nr:hypothetical protein [Chlamydiia bacterium]